MKNIAEQLKIPGLKFKSLWNPSFFSSQNKDTPAPAEEPTACEVLPVKEEAETQAQPLSKANRPYSVDDYRKLDGQAFGAMKVRYKPERGKFYVSLSYRSADFELNRRDIKRIAQPFNQRLKIWPIPTSQFEDLVAVLCRAEKRAQRRLKQTSQVLVQKSQEKAVALEKNSSQDSAGRKVAAAFLNKGFGDVRVKEVQGWIGLEFPYGCAGFYKIKESIKQLEGWSYWNKCWRVPFRHAERVQEILSFAAACQQAESERLANTEKSAPLAKTFAESVPAQKMAELEKSVEFLKQHVQQKGIYTKTPRHVQGEKLLNTMNAKGTGECWVIEEDKIWFVRNNGRDQDDWRHNNIATPSGGGAIGFHIPYQPHIAKMLRNAEDSAKGEGLSAPRIFP